MANKIKIISLISIFLILFVLGYIYDFDARQILQNIKTDAETDFFVSALLFVFIYTFVKFTFIPMSSASLLAGYMFGIFAGIVISLLAILFSSSLMFILARYMGRDAVSNFLDERFAWTEKYDDKLENNGIKIVLLFRILPILPLAVVNTGFGLSRVSFLDFLIATLIGVLPGVFFLVVAGKYITDWTNPIFWLSLSAYFILIIFAFIIARKMKIKKHEK